MLGPKKKKLLYGQKYRIYRAENRQQFCMCVFLYIYYIQNCLGICYSLHFAKISHRFFARLLFIAPLNGFMTFTFWLFQPYIYRRIYVYNAYMQPCISLNLCEFCTIFWHLKNTVNCVLWISMRVHIFHAIFIYISITKCPLALYIQSVYAHSHSHTRYYTILCGLISIFNYIFHMRAGFTSVESK